MSKKELSIQLHPKHGLCPVLTVCEICQEDLGIVLLGAKADEIHRKMFGEPYQPGTAKKMASGICDKCTGLLKDGAVGILCDDGRSLMFSKDFADANEIEPGKIYRMTVEQMDQFIEDAKEQGVDLLKKENQ